MRPSATLAMALAASGLAPFAHGPDSPDPRPRQTPAAAGLALERAAEKRARKNARRLEVSR